MPKQRKSRNTGTVYERSGRSLGQVQTLQPQMNYFDQRYLFYVNSLVIWAIPQSLPLSNDSSSRVWAISFHLHVRIS